MQINTATLVIVLLSSCGRVTPFESLDRSGLGDITPDARTVSDLRLAADLKNPIESSSLETAPDAVSPSETTPETALPDMIIASDVSTPEISCDIVIGPTQWSDDCQRSRNGWCNSPDIDAALKAPHPSSKSYKGTCQPGCFDNGVYVLLPGDQCHDGLTCRMVNVAPRQQHPLCVP